jgi:hypothetical protein
MDEHDVTESNSVAMEHIDGKWAVQIVEAGEVRQDLFETKEFAENYAAGQRIRLGLSVPGDQQA